VGLERSNKNDMSLQESARNGKKRKESAKEEHDLRDQNNLVASKNPFSCVYRAATQALRLVSVVSENAAKAQRKKATLVLYICGCFCMLGVVF
jgi:hypothetical protein